MKKFILVLFVLFLANVACKKTSINGGTTCGCSPLPGASFQLVVKNSAGVDLLDTKNAGAISKDKISFYREDAAGNIVKMYFGIQEPFNFGNDKLAYYQFFTSDLSYLQQSPNNVAFLKLDDKVYTVSITMGNSSTVAKVTIDKKDAEKETGVTGYAVFYLTK